MEKTDVQALASKMIGAVKSHVAEALAPLLARLEDFDARLKAIPPAAPGKDGLDGKDADPEAIRVAVEAAIAALPPPKDGRDGRDGKDSDAAELAALVPKPKDGAPGKDADPDVIRTEVARAVAAISPPAPGKDGEDGKEGEPGRDAAELDILPSIDEAKSYRRGTWASHNGGLIRAARATDPVIDGALLEAGWVVMVEGLAAVVVTQVDDDPREFTVAAMLTSGVKVVTPIRIPAVLDKGVWREGEHQAGDHVSWDGSGWIAQRANTDKPGTSDAWRLSTKRGRDGKDGKDGGENSGGAAPAVVRIK